MSSFYGAIALTGGAAGALDDIDGTGLNDGDGAIVKIPTSGEVYEYTLDADSGATESSPNIIAPDANAGNKRWLLCPEDANKHYVNPSAADQGVSTHKSIKALVDAIGATKKATLVLAHNGMADTTPYTLTTDETITSNITLEREPGAIIDGAGTLTYNGPPISNPYQQIFGTTISVVFGVGSIDIITPEMFGAKGDNSTNDAASWNAFTACVRTNGLRRLACKAEANYRVNSGINMTDLRNWGVIFEGNGAIISGYTNGVAVIDMLDSYGITTNNLHVYGGDTNKPSYGIQHGRGITGQDATLMIFNNVHTSGTFTTSAVYNLGSEVSGYDECRFWNSEQNGKTLYLDSRNEAHISSAFFTVTTAQDTWQSFNDLIAHHCSFEQIYTGGTSGGPAVRIVGKTNGFRFETCYAQAQHCEAFEIAYDHYNLYLDVHCETTDLTANVKFESSNGNMQLYDFTLNEYFAFGTVAVMVAEAANTVTLSNAKVSIGDSYVSIPVLGAVGTINFHGELNLNEATGNGLYNLANFNGLIGTVNAWKSKSVFTMPTVGFFKLCSQSDTTTYQVGHERNDEGAAIASAAELVLGTGEAFYVTGTTNVTSIRAADTYAGRNIVLVFGGVLTFTNGNNIVIGSNFVTNANSLIELYCMGGTNWLQRSRNQN